MKNTPTVVLLVLTLCGCASLNRPGDEWFGQDKWKHLAVATAASAGVTYGLEESGVSEDEARTGGVLFTLSLGGFKEWRDANTEGNYWSGKDFVWDFIGGVLGSVLGSSID